VATDTWNVQQYEKFKLERLQPGLDLIEMVEPRPDMRCVDLGCGTGELTSLLLNKLPGASIVGIDNSASMLAASVPHNRTGLLFVNEDIKDFNRPGEFDLVFSNAALHWVPDHESLFRRLVGMLKPGGQLVVQMPRNFDHVAHAAANELGDREPYAEFASKRHRQTVLDPAEYAVLLHSLGMQEIDVRMQIYLHMLESRDEIVEWVKGTLLTDFKKVMPEDLFERFLEEFRGLLRERLPDTRPFPYTYKRILMRAVVAG
jgi:trans-aconitate 2-methyltransferase